MRYASLVAVVALSACGGGSDGSATAPQTESGPSSARADYIARADAFCTDAASDPELSKASSNSRTLPNPIRTSGRWRKTTSVSFSRSPSVPEPASWRSSHPRRMDRQSRNSTPPTTGRSSGCVTLSPRWRADPTRSSTRMRRRSPLPGGLPTPTDSRSAPGRRELDAVGIPLAVGHRSGGLCVLDFA